MTEDPWTEKDAQDEIARVKKLAAARSEMMKKAMEIVKRLETSELADEKTLDRLNKKLTSDEKSLAKLLKPMPKVKVARRVKKKSKK